MGMSFNNFAAMPDQPIILFDSLCNLQQHCQFCNKKNTAALRVCKYMYGLRP